MAKKNLDKTCGAMKGVLNETIDDLTEVVKKSSTSMLATILEQGTANLSDLLDFCGANLKKKVNKNAKTKTEGKKND